METFSIVIFLLTILIIIMQISFYFCIAMLMIGASQLITFFIMTGFDFVFGTQITDPKRCHNEMVR